ITDYAEELLTGLDTIDWPEKTKLMQRNWIGKSEGGEVEFTLEDGKNSFRVFTTRADTLYGVTYVVLAPEHPLVSVITTAEHKAEVEAYKAETSKATEIERLSTAKEKSGAFTGAYAINPINQERVPVWIGDYVLYSYGTGAVMGVAAHDERDYRFAQKHNLPITRVIVGENGEDNLPYTVDGVMVNSEEFNGLTSEEGREKVLTKLATLSKGGKKVNYRLRDWLVSRQRYWGAPIPIIYCDKCGTVLDENLPVKLPYDVEFTPDGTSPLAKNEKFVHDCVCPKCGGKATREVDTLDTFVCSSWYFLRYPDNKNDKEAFSKEIADKMLPVDKYVGGAEHACMHLLYARFITKALRDMGYLDFDEPFKSLVHQGVIIGPDGNRMSKSHGNVVSPDEYVEKYGADVLRCYLAFGFKFIEGGPWSHDGIRAIAKWIERVERCVTCAFADYESTDKCSEAEDELKFVLNSAIKEVDADYADFCFNTGVARMMELTNALGKYDCEKLKNRKVYESCALALLKLLCPLAPHISEELWAQCGQPYSIVRQPFPVCDEKALTRNTVEVIVQINSKIRGKLTIPSGLSNAEVEKLALADDKISASLAGASIKKVIVIPNRLVNILI
ncbi:MAG: leucine--tRNA ligase, partial [Clostridia bacterium]